MVWAFQANTQGYRVEGLSKHGFPLPPRERKSLGASVGSAVGKAGLSALAIAGMMAFGGGDGGRPPRGESPQRRDLVMLGGSPECRAVQLQESPEPPGGMAVRQVWVLTSGRMAVLIPVGRPDPMLREELSAWQEWGRTLSGAGRILSGTEPEQFGRNVPGERMDPERMVEWFSFSPGDFVGCDAVMEGRLAYCVLTLQDGSGFAFDVGSSVDARMMAEAVQGFMGTRCG
ncbi:hypothetical protein ACL03H_13040 [Saccharopolyspora sp. MS10]|uniref:hypothetical protein n=1 Tax=Saccharopolyspora sp. MS10 TaxID=3385973 RepID=UPI0039A34C5E